MEDNTGVGQRFARLVEIMSELRGEHGCPWDREQDEKSITSFFLEEVFEAVDAVMAEDPRQLEEELGDVLMEIVFLALIYQERGHFSIGRVLEGITGKMIRRHPHVFDKKRAITSQEVIDTWQEHKNSEKPSRSVFAGLAGSAPALLRAFQVGQKASTYGFDWNGALEGLEKVKEEVRELEKTLREGRENGIRVEIGDLLFAVANLSRLAGHNPELALRAATRKFIKRFSELEKRISREGRKSGRASPEEMDLVWEGIKKSGL